VLAILMSWIAMIFYLWFRFGESKFGLATVIALVHDVCFTMGAVGVADALSGTPIGNFLGFSDIKVNLTMIAAFLTLMGYSANDTIVVFDRIRENMGGVRRRVDAALVDTSVNQTLSRTVLTSLTVLFVVLVLYVMGGPVIHGFAFVMTVGVIVGTYSSIFIASPILIGWETAAGNLKKLFRIVTFRSG
jgi:SecD/SecF fusion protein